MFWDLTAWGTKAHTEALVGSRIVRPEVSSLAMGYRDIARIARSKLQQSVDNRGTKCKETKRVNESPVQHQSVSVPGEGVQMIGHGVCCTDVRRAVASPL